MLIVLITEQYLDYVSHMDTKDMDMMSEKTGCQIAQWRAELDFYIHIRDNELKPQIQVLNHLLSTVSQRKDFNSKSQDTKMIYSLYH